MPIVSTNTIFNGSRKKILQVYIEGDGVGELDEEVISDPASDGDPEDTRYVIERIDSALAGFQAKLGFGHVAEAVPFYVLVAEDADTVDFKAYGGLKDKSDKTVGNGKLVISTDGLGTSADKGTLIIQLRKTRIRNVNTPL